MNLSELRRMLEVSVSRADLAGDYTSWINRGLRAVQRDFSYNCMRHVAQITMWTNTSSAQMPADYKELQIESGSVSLFSSSGRIPLEVVTREKLVNISALVPTRNLIFSASTAPRVYLANDGNTASLNTLDTTTSDATFEIAYFRYLPPLADDADENYLTREFEDMVQARIKAVAFSVINDPQAGTELALYALEKKLAIGFDTRQRTQGRTIQMGG